MNAGSRPSESELGEALLVVRLLLPANRQPRWEGVLQGDPARWSRLKMDDLFRAAASSPGVKGIDLDQELRTPDLVRNPAALLFRFSSQPCFLRGTVRELAEEVVEDDSLITVHGGNVALACHHFDGWIVWRLHE